MLYMTNFAVLCYCGNMKKYFTILLLIAGLVPSFALASIVKTAALAKKNTKHNTAVIAKKPANKSSGVVLFSLVINPMTVVAD